MTDLDKGRPGDGGDAPHPEVRSAPFFPGLGGRAGGAPSTAGVPLSSPPSVPPPASGSPPAAPAAPAAPPAPGPAGPPAPEHEPADRPAGEDVPPGPGTTATVKGRVTIKDEVIEKIARLAALEVGGVAALAGGPWPAGQPGTPGVRIHLQDNAVTLDLAVVVEYGSVIMDVAKAVKSNVARVIGLMLGMRVLAVNVSVEDVRVPE
ncbi:Asp23/Gls24 family envelope stress response protein [Actinomadura miaoliensis]|uniref:Asp23/Gls24 family envelope stress response protein n=1 Tax=Actinomadura miaoliensis TaxID=430685 RepID=A0ABP7X0X0_9ACTN